MQSIVEKRLWHTIAELSGALLDRSKYGVFDHPDATPNDAKEMDPPISLAALSYFDYKLMRMVEVNENLYGISSEGTFANQLMKEAPRWLFPVRKKIGLLERMRIMRWEADFKTLDGTPEHLTFLAPWTEPNQNQVTYVSRLSTNNVGNLTIFVTETKARWMNQDTDSIGPMTSVYLFAQRSEPDPKVIH